MIFLAPVPIRDYRIIEQIALKAIQTNPHRPPQNHLSVMNRIPLRSAGNAAGSSRSRLRSFLLLFSLLGLVSCASTPQTRIEKHPEMFTALSSKDQALVTKGGIREGLSKDGVYLAWGAPAGRSSGARSGKRFENWRYTRLAPVFIDHYAYGYGGSYYGSRRYRRGGYYNIGYYPSVQYVPYTSAVVSFSNGQVSSWQQQR